MNKPIPPEFIPLRKIKVRFSTSTSSGLTIDCGSIYRHPEGDIVFDPPAELTFSRYDLLAILKVMEKAAADPDFK